MPERGLEPLAVDADGARFTPYWAAKPLASADVPDVLVSGLVHPDGRALLAVGNLRQSRREVTITLGAEVGGFGSARDPLTGAEFDIVSGHISLDLAPEALQWILLESTDDSNGRP